MISGVDGIGDNVLRIAGNCPVKSDQSGNQELHIRTFLICFFGDQIAHYAAIDGLRLSRFHLLVFLFDFEIFAFHGYRKDGSADAVFQCGGIGIIGEVAVEIKDIRTGRNRIFRKGFCLRRSVGLFVTCAGSQ